MQCRTLPIVAVTLLTAVGVRAAAAQQVFESVGERALGMGGAFVAVANDATAVHWNPAGLAAGPAGGMTIGWHRFQSGNQKAPPQPGPGRRSASFTSLGTLPLGLSYGQFETATLVSDELGGISVETLQTRQFSATVVQTVATGVVVGTTLKYVRGHLATGPVDAATAGGALEAASNLKAPRRGRFDLDIGVLATMAKLQVGLTWKNLRSPSFGDLATVANTLPRQARLGVAILPSSGLTLAMDLDLNTVDLRDGLRRMFAFGGEGRVGPRLVVRSGMRWNLEGSRQPVGTVGLSLGLRAGVWLDSHYAQGRFDEQREFGAALRAGF